MTPSKPARDMTMREAIAAQCMTALIQASPTMEAARLAFSACSKADALIAELGKTEQPPEEADDIFGDDTARLNWLERECLTYEFVRFSNPDDTPRVNLRRKLGNAITDTTGDECAFPLRSIIDAARNKTPCP